MKHTTPTRSRRLGLLALATFLIASGTLHAQHCPDGIRVEGAVLDPTGAALTNATLVAKNGVTATTDATGHYDFSCLAAGTSHLSATAPGFSAKELPLRARGGKRFTSTSISRLLL